MTDEIDLADEGPDSSLTSITRPSFKKMPLEKFYDYKSEIVHYEALPEISRAQMVNMVSMIELTEVLNEAERRAASFRNLYKKTYNRHYLNSTARTDTQRKIEAEILSEESEDNAIVYEQIARELKRHLDNLEKQRKNLEQSGHNVRKQLEIGGE